MLATLMFSVALLTIDKSWKQLLCPTAEELTKKMQHMHTIEFFPAIKNNNVMSFAGKWLKDD